MLGKVRMSRKLMVLLLGTLAIGLTWMVFAPTSPPTRTRIDVSALGPQVGEQVPDFASHAIAKTLPLGRTAMSWCRR